MYCYTATLQAQKRHGIEMRVIPETDKGDIDIAALQGMLAQQVGAVHVSLLFRDGACGLLLQQRFCACKHRYRLLWHC